jgi:hypothetical protein
MIWPSSCTNQSKHIEATDNIALLLGRGRVGGGALPQSIKLEGRPRSRRLEAEKASDEQLRRDATHGFFVI